MSKGYGNNIVTGGRDGQANVVAGCKGHGKSTWLRGFLDHKSPFRHSLVYKYGRNIEDPAFEGYPVINSLKEYRGGRVIVNGNNGKVKYSDFIKFCSYSRDINVVVDDAKLFERNVITDEMNELLVINRRLPADVWLLYQGVTDIPIETYSLVNNIVLFHTTDDIRRKGHKIAADAVEPILKARERIRKRVLSGDKYYKEVIKLA